MKLAAILSVATLLPLVLAIANPATDDPCKSECQPILDESQKCTALSLNSNLDPGGIHCMCSSKVISSKFDAYVTLSSLLFFLIFYCSFSLIIMPMLQL